MNAAVISALQVSGAYDGLVVPSWVWPLVGTVLMASFTLVMIRAAILAIRETDDE